MLIVEAQKGALIHITGGPDLTLKESEEIANALTFELDQRANVIWGARVQKEFEGRVRVMAIMTGVQSPQVLGPVKIEYLNPYPNTVDSVKKMPFNQLSNTSYEIGFKGIDKIR